MASMGRHIFFTGKGGVGKSTVSLLAGKFLARQGYITKVTSLDPAHNTADILDMPLEHGSNKISPGLWAQEVCLDDYLKAYLNSVEKEMKARYQYTSAFSFTDHFSAFKYSPGLEEFALVRAFETIRQDAADVDYFIWDMPPTGLSLRFFQYPKVSLVWLEKLAEIRSKIIEKQSVMAKIQGDKDALVKDKLQDSIHGQIAFFKAFEALLTDSRQTRILTITNDESLSRAEALRLKKSLSELDIKHCDLVLNRSNKVANDWVDEDSGRTVKGFVLPQCSEQFIGDKLDEYLDMHVDHFAIIFK